MSTRKPLPQIAPCPCGNGFALRCWRDEYGDYAISGECGWEGPPARTKRAAIIAWNRRSDAETKLRSVAKGWEDRSIAQGKIIDKLIKERDEAERRGAMAAAQWLDENGYLEDRQDDEFASMSSSSIGDSLRQAINRGEVLLSAPEPSKKKARRT